MTELFCKRLNPALEQLDDEKSLGIALLALSRTVIDRPELYKKIEDSYSGHALDLMIKVSLREIRMWCCRVWEKNGNSLPIVASLLSQKQLEISEWRKGAHPDWPETFLGLDKLPQNISEFCNQVTSISDGDLIKKLRITRDEHFAHLLAGKAGSRKFLDTQAIEQGYSWSEVQELVSISLGPISQAILIWRFHSHDVERSISVYQRYCENFGEVLPNLSDAEQKLFKAKARKNSPWLFQDGSDDQAL